MTCLSLREIPEQMVHCTQCAKPIVQSEARLGQAQARFICTTGPLGGTENNHLSSSHVSSVLELTHEPCSAGECRAQGELSLDLGCWSAAIQGAVVPPRAERQLSAGKMGLLPTKLLRTVAKKLRFGRH